MRRVAMVFAMLLGVLLLVPVLADTGDKIAVLDDCDPDDPAWVAIGGCFQKDGDTTRAEFGAHLPLGHPAWRNEPAYIKISLDGRVKVKNQGGRDHTFTLVAQYGRGYVPGVNNPPGPPGPLDPTAIEECKGGTANPAVSSSFIRPAEGLQVRGLSEGTHKFQCCIHPWMRALVRVSSKKDD